MKELELDMQRFLHANDFVAFKHHQKLFKESLDSTLEAVGA